MARPAVDSRLRRLLALVPWVAAMEGPSVEDVCARFGCTEQELAEDLERLFMCGLYPFTPDTMIEVDMEDGRVWIRYADIFNRPLRLTPAEGLAVVAAGAAVLSLPGSDPSGPLARGLAKLAAVLGIDPDEMVEVELGAAPPEVLGVLEDAARTTHQVEIEYYSFGRDEWAVRVIDPYRVFGSAGQWYVAAYCHRVDDRRLFRLDRIRRATPLDTTFEPPAEPPPAVVFEPRPEDPVVVLELAPSAAWVIEQYPNEGVKALKGGKLRVQLRVSERAWLERLLLRLGPAATVVAGAEGIGRAAAMRVLGRYRGGDGTATR